MEFSKKICLSIIIGYAVLIFLCVFLITFKNANLDVLLGTVTPIPVSVVGFYFNKSKAENKLKIQKIVDIQNQGNGEEDSSI